jgi:PPOX class probable F420-dependent enzyme
MPLMGRFAKARVARLATASASAVPHLVPVVFACHGDAVVIMVDHKPKSTTDLKRIRNIRENSRVSLLVDEYDDAHWQRLWWVRVDGVARVADADADRAQALAWLCAKYAQYRQERPAGPVIWIDVTKVSGWSAGPGFQA